MHRLMILVALAMLSLHAGAQDKINYILQEIEQNNTTLKALRQTSDAMKLENKTGITLADPELGFGYMWNNTAGMPDKKNVSLMQSFDIATVSGQRSRMAEKKNELVEWQYRVDRMNIMLEAKQHVLDVIYYNALLAELAIRRGHAVDIAGAQKKRLECGEGNQLEYNNVVLNLLKLDGEIKRITTEQQASLAQLARLNGGKSVVVDVKEYPVIMLPGDFNAWYSEASAKNPVLSYVKQEIEVSRAELSLSKKMSLPTFSAGYSGEFLGSERTQGITIGMSIPLWSNKNKVRQAKTAVMAAESRHEDARRQYYGNLLIMYKRTLGLQQAADTYRSSLANANNSELLKKALDEGEISVLDYLLEIGLYYDAVNEALDAERAYQKAYAELSAVEL